MLTRARTSHPCIEIRRSARRFGRDCDSLALHAVEAHGHITGTATKRCGDQVDARRQSTETRRRASNSNRRSSTLRGQHDGEHGVFQDLVHRITRLIASSVDR